MADEAIHKQDLAEQVYRILLAKIVEREVPTGLRFTLRETAQSLKVSVTPVRDAILRLQVEGFVEVGPRGWLIPSLTLEIVREVFEARDMIEVYAAARAVERATDAELGALDEIIRGMAEVFADATCLDPVQYWELNARFHQTLVALAHNQRLIDLHAQLHCFALLRRLRALPQGGIDSADFQAHRAIQAAMHARDVVAVEWALRAHLVAAHNSLLARVAENESVLDAPPAQAAERS